jgi:hypothetical protein
LRRPRAAGEAVFASARPIGADHAPPSIRPFVASRFSPMELSVRCKAADGVATMLCEKLSSP